MRTMIVSALTGLICLPAVASAQPGATTTGSTTVQVEDAPTPAASPALPDPSTYVPAQPEYEEVRDSIDAPMFTSGALVFAASYGSAVLVASNDHGRGNGKLYVPVVGPWLALNDRGSCDPAKTSCDHETTAKVLLIADGIFQAAGLVGMVDGLLSPTSHRIVTHTAKRQKSNFRLQPTLTNGNPGLAALGKF